MEVKQYNIYVDNVFVGGKFDNIFYIKNLPSRSGEIKVAAVGADGREGKAAKLKYNLLDSPSDITVDSSENGDFLVSWKNPKKENKDITVTVESRNKITTLEPVSKQITV